MIILIWYDKALVDPPSSSPRLRSEYWIPSIYIHQYDHINMIISIWCDQMLVDSLRIHSRLMLRQQVCFIYVDKCDHINFMWSYQYNMKQYRYDVNNVNMMFRVIIWLSENSCKTEVSIYTSKIISIWSYHMITTGIPTPTSSRSIRTFSASFIYS